MTIYDCISSYISKNKSNIFTFCVSTNGMKKMTLNLVKSCQANKENIVVIALDNDICDFIKNECDVIQYLIDKNSNQPYEYHTEDFKIIAWYRYFIINEFLRNNKTVIYLDIDIYVNKQFSNQILNELEQYDCVIQTNGKNCCTGFFAIKPSEKTIDVFNRKNLESQNYLEYLDQEFFNSQIYDKKVFKIKLLDISLYPNGKYYYDNSEKINNKCYLIHFNNIVGYGEKISRMKKYNKWII